MKEQRQLHTRDDAGAHRSSEIAKRQVWCNRAEIQEITRVDRYLQPRHRCHRNLGQRSGFSSPAIWLERAEPLIEGAKEQLALLLLRGVQFCSPEIVSSGERPQVGRKRGSVILVASPAQHFQRGLRKTETGPAKAHGPPIG